jgi:tetratricopeptide repeat protein
LARPGRARGTPPRAPRRPTRPAAPAPAPPWHRDAWALAPLIAAIALAAHAWFPFIGEPLADDFDFLHHTYFTGPGQWLDGGGSHFYWRPLARQLFYRVLGGAMLAHPAWVAAFEAALTALAGLLLYRMLRRYWPGGWAAAAASFPLLIEAARPLVSCHSNFQDLGAILFSAVALHEVSRSRLPSALVALLAALLCKEMAVVTAMALPFLAAPAPDSQPLARRARLRWAAAGGTVVLAWAIVYQLVVRRAGLLLVRDAVEDPRALATPWPARFLWACRESLADALNLPALSPFMRTAALAAFVTIAVTALAVVAFDRGARARLRARAPWIVAGLAWFALATATLADVYPDWRPYRSPFAAIGIGVAATAFLGAVRPTMLAALVVLRLATFALSPGPPAAIAVAMSGGYSIDFPKLVRLQRLVGETRRVLAARLPHPSPGSLVATHFYPRGALFAFAHDRSLQTWYRDTTLRWVSLEAQSEPTHQPPSLVLEFQPTPPGQIVAVNLEAIWSVDLAGRLIDQQRWQPALDALARSDSLQHDPAARLFESMVAGKRALALGGLGRTEEAERQAARALTLWPGNDDARFARLVAALSGGRLRDAEALLDTLVRAHPSDTLMRRIQADTRRALAGGRR